jgi:hypothetical protein
MARPAATTAGSKGGARVLACPRITVRRANAGPVASELVRYKHARGSVGRVVVRWSGESDDQPELITSASSQVDRRYSIDFLGKEHAAVRTGDPRGMRLTALPRGSPYVTGVPQARAKRLVGERDRARELADPRWTDRERRGAWLCPRRTGSGNHHIRHLKRVLVYPLTRPQAGPRHVVVISLRS